MGHDAGEDRHWLQADDYFYADRPYKSGWIYTKLAKMSAPPADGTKGEARFFGLRDSNEVWSRHYWQTRPAEPAHLQVGALVICFESNGRDGAYQAPRDKHNARTGSWFMGRITDTSDLYKGHLTVATYKCAPEALRVPISSSPDAVDAGP